MSGWSNDESLLFLEYYQTETCIWNPKDVNHKDKNKVADAWSRVAQLMGKPVKELKSKKEILMTTFRKHLKKKKQDSIRSGAGAEDIYKPTWFAYELMESFLLPVYTCIDGINTETQSQQNAVHEETEEIDGDRTDTVTTPSRPSTSNNKRRRPVTETAEIQMATAFQQLTNDIRQRRSECRPAHEDDDCDLYAKLLAIKLRELPNDERKLIMYQIDGLFISRINQRSNARHTPSPQYYSRPSSMASAYAQHTPSPQFQDIPSRPASVNTVYSEPIPNTQRFFPSQQTCHSDPFSNIIIEHRSRPIAPSTSQAPSQINVISDRIIQPAPPESNIINEALLKAFEDFQSSPK